MTSKKPEKPEPHYDTGSGGLPQPPSSVEQGPPEPPPPEHPHKGHGHEEQETPREERKEERRE